MGDFQAKTILKDIIMPVLTSDDLGQMGGIFNGNGGKALAEILMHILSIDRINELYDRNCHLSGPDFASAILKDVGLGYSIPEIDDILPDGPFITISNHPCGHLDGIALVDIFGHLRPDYRIMANQILGRIRPLEDSMIKVVPLGNQSSAPTSASISGVKAALKHIRAGGSLGLFPSGAVSDLSLKARCVRDRAWQEPVIKLLMKAEVPIIPVRFFDGNSLFYYSLGLIDWRIRLLRLPAEVFNKEDRIFRIGVGRIISVEEQKAYGSDTAAFGDFLRHSVYGTD